MRKKGMFLAVVMMMTLVMSVAVQAQGGLRQGGGFCLRGDFERCSVYGLSVETMEAIRGYRALGYRMMGAGENMRIICPNGQEMRMGDARMSQNMNEWAQRAFDCPRFGADFEGERGLCWVEGGGGLCGRNGAGRGLGLGRR